VSQERSSSEAHNSGYLRTVQGQNRIRDNSHSIPINRISTGISSVHSEGVLSESNQERKQREQQAIWYLLAQISIWLLILVTRPVSKFINEGDSGRAILWSQFMTQSPLLGTVFVCVHSAILICLSAIFLLLYIINKNTKNVLKVHQHLLQRNNRGTVEQPVSITQTAVQRVRQTIGQVFGSAPPTYAEALAREGAV
jgi:hypothetical protein